MYQFLKTHTHKHFKLIKKRFPEKYVNFVFFTLTTMSRVPNSNLSLFVTWELLKITIWGIGLSIFATHFYVIASASYCFTHAFGLATCSNWTVWPRVITLYIWANVLDCFRFFAVNFNGIKKFKNFRITFNKKFEY